MLAAAKEETSFALSGPGVLFLLAAREGVRENSRPGFTRKTAALHQGRAEPKFQTALRDSRNLAANTRRMSLMPQAQARHKFNPCNNRQAVNFVKTHEADATTLASEIKVPANYVLAVAGDESAYGTSRIAIGANNYFGLHAGAPGSTGPWSGNPIVAAFPESGGFMASGQSFVQLASPLLRGLTA